MTTESNGLPWKKINTIIGIVVGVFALVGGVIGSQQYMEEKYAEQEELTQVVEMVEHTDGETKLMIAYNLKAAQLNQYRLEQKIYQDRIDRKRDMLKEQEFKEPTTPLEYRRQQQNINELEKDIRDLNRDLDKLEVDKGF